MRMLSWNLQHGGGTRIERLGDALLSYDADVVLLSEYRHNKAGADLRSRLKEAGYAYQTAPHAEPRQNIIFTASRQPFEALLEQGRVDTWRSRNPEAREFTWFSRGYNNGFRLDHALASPTLNKKIKKVYYSHQEREDGVTDHSLMVLDTDHQP